MLIRCITSWRDSIDVYEDSHGHRWSLWAHCLREGRVPSKQEQELMILKIESQVLPQHEQLLKGSFKDPKFNRIISFGDSFSDIGALRSRSFGSLMKDYSFYRGRASNGPLWIEYISHGLGIPLVNYAVAGSTTRDTSFWMHEYMIGSFADQVDDYLDSDYAKEIKDSLILLPPVEITTTSINFVITTSFLMIYLPR